MNIRKLGLEDAERFRALRIEATGESPTSFYLSQREIIIAPNEEFQAQVTPSLWNAVFGAFENEELIGIVGIRRDPKENVRHKASVWGLYTKPSYRGRGIARGLVSTAIDEARSNSEVTLVSLIVNSANIAAISLYASFGFKSFGTERRSMYVNGVAIDEDHMALEFAEPERVAC